MKAILEFNLPEERTDHLAAVKAGSMAVVLWDMIYNTRKDIEYAIDYDKIDSYETLERVMQRLIDLMDRYGIVIDDLVE